MPDTTRTPQTCDFDVDLSIGCVVTVPAHLVPAEFDHHVPKRLHNWPAALVDTIETRFAAELEVSERFVESGILQVRVANSLEDHSSG